MTWVKVLVTIGGVLVAGWACKKIWFAVMGRKVKSIHPPPMRARPAKPSNSGPLLIRLPKLG
jgi:hypothetical protein